jgi:predicted transcriptional regulator
MNKSKAVNVKLDTEQHKKALNAAKKHRVTLSVIIRWALDEFLSRKHEGRVD